MPVRGRIICTDATSYYEEYLYRRTDYAKEYDLRNLSAITLDWKLILFFNKNYIKCLYSL